MPGSRRSASNSAKTPRPSSTHVDNKRANYDSSRLTRNNQNGRVRKIQLYLRKQKKTESLEQFHADLVELASRADCRDKEDEWVRDMFTAHMQNEKIAEELLAQTKSTQYAYEYAKRREKGIEHSRTMKINPFGNRVTATK